jgi:hypothetical protein
VDALLAALLTSYVPRLSGQLEGLPPEAVEAAAAAFADAAEGLEAAGRGVMAAVADSLTERSVVVLKQVRCSQHPLTPSAFPLGPPLLRLLRPQTALGWPPSMPLQPKLKFFLPARGPAPDHPPTQPHPLTLCPAAAARHRGDFPHDGAGAPHPPLPLRVDDPDAPAAVCAGVRCAAERVVNQCCIVVQLFSRFVCSQGAAEAPCWPGQRWRCGGRHAGAARQCRSMCGARAWSVGSRWSVGCPPAVHTRMRLPRRATRRRS